MIDTIELNDIVKLFNKKKVLDIPNKTFIRGSIISCTGLNGSGKTTFIKIIAGLLTPDSGTISIFNTSVSSKKYRDSRAFVLESGKGYYEYLTARENIQYFLGINKISYKNKKDKIEELSTRFNFNEHMDKKVSELSQGNRQVMSIIINLIKEPEVLLLDEPTNGLDEIRIKTLEDLLLKANKNMKTTIFITSHDKLFVQNISSQILIFDTGKIIKDEVVGIV
ncbi:MAG: ABC transporter ATP-binding protein [Streptococcaceae bacterium]|nr:ABC transporter ATP-binding protein [Streptococcaceae bacterium]